MKEVAGTGSARDDVSLTAEVLLLAVDPGDGGLVPHARRRLSRALVATRGTGGGLPGGAWRSRRAATGELARVGLIAKRGPRLTDRPRAMAHWRRVCACIQEPRRAETRDLEVLVLLAWSGVLQHRLNKDERRLANRRVRELLRSAEDGHWGLAGMENPVPDWVGRLGGAAKLYSEIDLFDSPELTDFGWDEGGFGAITGR